MMSQFKHGNFHVNALTIKQSTISNCKIPLSPVLLRNRDQLIVSWLSFNLDLRSFILPSSAYFRLIQFKSYRQFHRSHSADSGLL